MYSHVRFLFVVSVEELPKERDDFFLCCLHCLRLDFVVLIPPRLDVNSVVSDSYRKAMFSTLENDQFIPDPAFVEDFLAIIALLIRKQGIMFRTQKQYWLRTFFKIIWVLNSPGMGNDNSINLILRA